jgi:hypothetical protein
LSLSINVTDSAEVERQPGLREETLREIIKKRRTYPHEAVSMATELLELRARLNNPAASMGVMPAGRRPWRSPTADEVKAAHHLASLLKDAFPWGTTYPGDRFWLTVHRLLEDF